MVSGSSRRGNEKGPDRLGSGPGLGAGWEDYEPLPPARADAGRPERGGHGIIRQHIERYVARYMAARQRMAIFPLSSVGEGKAQRPPAWCARRAIVRRFSSLVCPTGGPVRRREQVALNQPPMDYTTTAPRQCQAGATASFRLLQRTGDAILPASTPTYRFRSHSH